jgi:hypothetical protein
MKHKRGIYEGFLALRHIKLINKFTVGPGVEAVLSHCERSSVIPDHLLKIVERRSLRIGIASMPLDASIRLTERCMIEQVARPKS